MTPEDKELLLKDLCARLPYNVVINCTEEDDERTNFNCFFTGEMVKDIQNEIAMWNIKPYLRPMSSMTEREKEEFENITSGKIVEGGIVQNGLCIKFATVNVIEDWLNAHHFDYRGLIEKGLAIEVTEENNPYKN